MGRAIALGLAVTMTGCFGGDAEPCAAPQGVYEAQFVRKSGTCASAMSFVTNFDGDGGSGCSGSESYSDDMCHVELEGECLQDDGSSAAIVGALSQSGGAQQLEGTVQVIVRRNGQTVCQAVYHATYTKL